MELTSKQRAQLRSLANGIDTIVIVGKEGLGDNLIAQVNDALESRELGKGRVRESGELTPREVCDQLCKLTRREPVQVIGRRLVVYRESRTNKRIEL